MDRVTKGLQLAWTPEECDRLARFYADRLDTAYIARRLGRSADAIKNKARTLGIVRARPGYRKPGTSSRTQRCCMSCGSMFSSWGIGNRMCVPCRGHDAGPDLTSPIDMDARSRI